MEDPLIDSEGFPLPNVDIYSVRYARQTIIHLRNDLKSIMTLIESELLKIHSHQIPIPHIELPDKAFAIINAVSPQSPAYECGLIKGDKIIKFGHIKQSNHDQLKKMLEFVISSENVSIKLIVERNGELLELNIVPKEWEKPGLLGCHILPL